MTAAVPRSAVFVLAALMLQSGIVRAQVIDITENMQFDRPEAWAMKYFTSAMLLTEFGTPPDLGPAGVELGIEGGWVPRLDTTERQVGFNGAKTEDLNRTSLLGRLRVAVGLPRHYRITLGYTPPVTLSGATPNLVSLSGGKVFRADRTWGLGAQLSGQLGHVEGDFTCTREEAAAGDDLGKNPFGCERESDDRVEHRYVSLELVTTRYNPKGGVEPHAGLAVNYLDMEFQVDARYSGLVDRTLLLADGFTVSATAGVGVPVSDKLRFGAQLFFTPLDVVRPPSTSNENDGLFNARAMLAYRLR
jgi:hypothetical protein